MSAEQALGLIMDALATTLWTAGPILAVTLVAGLLVGVAQTVLQINEQSVSFVVKVAALIAVLLGAGPAIGGKVADYTKSSLRAVEHVVR